MSACLARGDLQAVLVPDEALGALTLEAFLRGDGGNTEVKIRFRIRNRVTINCSKRGLEL